MYELLPDEIQDVTEQETGLENGLFDIAVVFLYHETSEHLVSFGIFGTVP